MVSCKKKKYKGLAKCLNEIILYDDVFIEQESIKLLRFSLSKNVFVCSP